MFKIIRDSFKITNEYIVIATPLILFSLFSSIYLMISSRGNSLSLTITAILFLLMFGAFLSGWLYMIKRAVTNPEDEANNRLFFDFPSGVGEYFLNVLGMIFVIVVVAISIIVIVALLGKKFIGDPGVTYSQMTEASTSVEAMKALLNSLNPEQLSRFKNWNLLLFFGMLFQYFILMFYSSSIYFKEKNPFKAFWVTIKDTLGRKIFSNIFLFFLILASYIILSVLTAIFGGNMFAHFLLTLLNFYYITFIAILIFNYYYTNFAKIGSQVDTLV